MSDTISVGREFQLDTVLGKYEWRNWDDLQLYGRRERELFALLL